jgi:hypothetical protein
MRRFAVALLVVCSACASAPRTHVLVDYKGAAPVQQVMIETVNATGHDLPMPPPGIVEQAVRFVTRASDAEPTVPDAFERAAAERLADMHIRVAAATAGSDGRLRITLLDWDVRDGAATGAVVFVTADYRLLGAHDEVLWQVRQDHLPVRPSAPNLDRSEVTHVVGSCVDLALVSLPAPHATAAH